MHMYTCTCLYAFVHVSENMGVFRHPYTHLHVVSMSVRDLLHLIHPHTVPGQDSPVHLPPLQHNQQPSESESVCAILQTKAHKNRRLE